LAARCIKGSDQRYHKGCEEKHFQTTAHHPVVVQCHTLQLSNRVGETTRKYPVVYRHAALVDALLAPPLGPLTACADVEWNLTHRLGPAYRACCAVCMYPDHSSRVGFLLGHPAVSHRVWHCKGPDPRAVLSRFQRLSMALSRCGGTGSPSGMLLGTVCKWADPPPFL